MANDPGSAATHTSTTVVAVITLIVAVVSAIPGFLGLNKEQALIYYSTSKSGILIPNTADEQRIRAVLASNGIPTEQFSVSLINQGNKEAPEVRLSLSVPGKIMSAWTDPAESKKPVWVQLPDLSQAKGQSQIQPVLKAMATTKPVTIHVGYEKTEQGAPGVEVFVDGKPAASVSDAGAVAPWSPIAVFKLPLIILGVGLLLVVLWAMGVVISKNPRMKATLTEFAIKSATEIFKAVSPFRF